MISVSCLAGGSAPMEGSEVESWWGSLGSGSQSSFISEGLMLFCASFLLLGNLVIMDDYKPGSKTGALLLRRKCSQSVHPTHTFSSRQPQSKSLPPQTTQAVPGTERSLSLMVHFVGKSLFLVLAGPISLVGLGFSSCGYPRRRMTPRSAWQKTSSCYLHVNP